MTVRVLGVGPLKPRICIVGESPGRNEVIERIPFVGQSGRFMNRVLNRVGLRREDIYITNILKTQPEGNKFSALYDPEEHLEPFLDELRRVDANIYVFMGGNVSKALLGLDKIIKRRGSILPFLDSKALLTYHPSYIIRTHQYKLFTICAQDFRKAKKHSFNKSYPLQPQVSVVKTADALDEFIYYNKDEEYLTVDIECTTGTTGIPICVGLSFTKNEGISVPLFSKLPWIDDKLWKKEQRIDVKSSFRTGVIEADLPRIWRSLDRLFRNPERKVGGHNFKYDEARLESLGFKFTNFFIDSALAGFVLQPEFQRNLGFWNSIYTNIPYFKDEGDAYNPNRRGFNDYLLYNAKDAVSTNQIIRAQILRLTKSGLLSIYLELQHKLHGLYRGVEIAGFTVDEQKHWDLCTKYILLERETQQQLNALATYLTGRKRNVNVNAHAKLKELMYDEMRIPVVGTDRSTDEDEVAKILLKHPDLDPARRSFIRAVLTQRKIKKLTGPNLLAAERDYDGRMRTSYFIIGTTTGRTSTQVVKPPIRPIALGWAFQTLPKHNKIGKDIREILIPAPGNVFIQVDSAQAEARVVSLLAGDLEFLALMDKIDIHAWTAAKCFGGEARDYPKDKPERFIGKVGRHAFNLGIKKVTLYNNLVSDANKFGVELKGMTIAKAENILQSIHRSTPRIRNVFQRDVRACLETNKTLWSPHGFRRIFHSQIDDKSLREAYSYLPQNTVTTNTKLAMLAVKQEFGSSVAILIEAHDSFLSEVHKSIAAKFARRIKELMERPIDFSRCSLPRGRLVIPAELEIGRKNYGELEEMELVQ